MKRVSGIFFCDPYFPNPKFLDIVESPLLKTTKKLLCSRSNCGPILPNQLQVIHVLQKVPTLVYKELMYPVCQGKSYADWIFFCGGSLTRLPLWGWMIPHHLVLVHDGSSAWLQHVFQDPSTSPQLRRQDRRHQKLERASLWTSCRSLEKYWFSLSPSFFIKDGKLLGRLFSGSSKCCSRRGPVPKFQIQYSGRVWIRSHWAISRLSHDSLL